MKNKKAVVPLPEGNEAGIYSTRSGGVYSDKVGDAKHRATRPVSAAYERAWGSAPSNNKTPSLLRLRLSTLLWLASFVFIVLLISVVAAMFIWHLFVVLGVLTPFAGDSAFHAFLFVLLMSLLIGAAFAVIGGDFLLRPLHRLSRLTKEVAKGNFGVRVKVSRPQELARLAESFNDMAKELAGIETLRADFVSNISHEFKTPVAAILGFAKLLMRDDLTDDKRREYLDIIVFESERLSRLSSNVLLLSNLENASRGMAQTEYALDEQLRKVILLLSPQMAKRQLTANIDLESVRVTGREELLHHLWINLLGNAIKFSHIGGVVDILLKVAEGEVVVSITDYGVGMTADVKSRVFEKFYQGDSSRATEGNGLGLALAKRIVELESGQITVESAPGKGACFVVRLPVLPGK